MFHKIKSTWIFPLLLALYEMAAYLSTDAYLPALPNIVKDFNTAPFLVQWTLSTWFMGGASTPLLIGPLCDHIGRRRVLFIGGLLFLIATAGCALTHEIYCLLAFRFLQGATIASIIIPGYATIHELFDRAQAIHTLTVMNSITVLAPSFGPLLGAIFLYFTDWRWIFGILAIWAALTLVGLFFKMPETKSPSSEKTSFKQTVLQYKNILSNRSFMLSALISRLLFLPMLAWIAVAPFLLIEHFHFSTFAFGIAQACVFGSFIISARLVKWFMQYFGLQTLIYTGISLSLISGVYACIAAYAWPNIPQNIIIGVMLFATGLGLTYSILERLMIESSTEPMGSRMAMSFCFTSAAAMLGSVISSVFCNTSLISFAGVLLAFSVAAAGLKITSDLAAPS